MAGRSRSPSGGGIPADSTGHLYTQVRKELEANGISSEEINQEGLRISTTIDPSMQKQAVEAAQKVLKGQPANLRTAVVSIDPRTGNVLAYYGGDNGVGITSENLTKIFR